MHHAGGHLFDHIDGIVQIHFLQHFLQLCITEGTYQQLLLIVVHFDEGFGGQFLGEQTEQNRQPFFRKFREQQCHICRLHIHQLFAHHGIFAFFQQIFDKIHCQIQMILLHG